MIDTFLLRNTYNAESKEIKDVIRCFDAHATYWHQACCSMDAESHKRKPSGERLLTPDRIRIGLMIVS